MEFLDYFESNRYVRFVKDNYALVIAVPYIFGGFRQFISLTAMSFDLIVYFSISQLFIDGIISVIKIITFILLGNVFFIAFRKYRNAENKKAFIRIRILVILLLLIFLCGATTYIFTNYENFGDGQLYKFTMHSVIIIIASIFLFYARKDNDIFWFMLISSLSLQPILAVKRPIVNIEKQTSQLKDQFKDVRLQYYNDQYLFYTTGASKLDYKIIIVKMEDIFEDNKSSK